MSSPCGLKMKGCERASQMVSDKQPGAPYYMKKNNPDNHNKNNDIGEAVPYGQPYRADSSWSTRKKESKPQPASPQQFAGQTYSDQPQYAAHVTNNAARYTQPAPGQNIYAAAGANGYGAPPQNYGNPQQAYANGRPSNGRLPNPNGRRPKKKRRLIGLWITLGIVVVLLIAAASIIGHYINRYNNEIMVSQEFVDDWEEIDGSGNQIIRVPRKEKDIENFLLLGVDGDMDEGTVRSDSMMVVSVNSKDKTIKIASLMRDIWAYYPDSDKYDKLNAAHAYGGPGHTINIINHNFDLDIQKFVVTDFSGLQNIIDVLGGVRLDVTNAEAEHITGIETGGSYNLTGLQALDYSRIRVIDSDFSRVERQRTVIMAMLSELRSEDLQTQLSTIDESMQFVKSNIPAKDLSGDMTSLVLSSSSGMEQLTVPEDGMYTVNASGTWYMELDWDRQIESLHEFLYGE